MKNARTATAADLKRLAAAGELTGFFIVSDEDYHGGPGVSASGLCDFLRSPAHYQHSRTHQKRTAAKDFGTQFHEYTLQPERFAARYAIEPANIVGPKNRNPAKALWDAFKARCEDEGREPLDKAAHEAISTMANAVSTHTSAAIMLENSFKELAAYTTDPETGFIMKAKADIAMPWGVADLKTTEDARLGPFARTVVAWHYHVKAAWYLRVFNSLLDEKMDAFVWIAVEKAAPHGVACYAASPRMLEKGDEIGQAALVRMLKCQRENHWPAYSEEIEAIELPEYAYKGAD